MRIKVLRATRPETNMRVVQEDLQGGILHTHLPVWSLKISFVNLHGISNPKSDCSAQTFSSFIVLVSFVGMTECPIFYGGSRPADGCQLVNLAKCQKIRNHDPQVEELRDDR